MSRFRAWQFQHPDFDRAGKTLGGLVVSASGGIAMVEDEAAVRQALLLLISTSPGERVMRPQYGSSLNRLVFAPNDESTAGLAIHYVRQAITRWEPRVEIIHLDAASHPAEAGQLVIELHYRIKSSQREAQLAFVLDLRGEKT